MGVVGLKFAKTTFSALGKLVAVQIAERDGSIKDMALTVPKATELTALTNKPKQKGYCCV